MTKVLISLYTAEALATFVAANDGSLSTDALVELGAAVTRGRARLGKGYVITSAGPKKISVIKSVRQHTGMGLKDAKNFVESTRPVLKAGTPNLAELVRDLRAVGATVEKL